MLRITGSRQSYAWGTNESIPKILHIPADDEPFAEYWLGTHPLGDARLDDGSTLSSRLTQQPELLGEATVEAFAGKLPYLMKLLSAGSPLSLQAHPSRVQAEEGYAHESLKGLPISSPERSFKDDWPKPEAVIALEPFEGLVGFREPVATAELFESLPDVIGTGYSEAEMNAILMEATDAAVSTLTGLEEEEAEAEEREESASFGGTGLGDDEDEDDGDYSAVDETRIETAPDELAGLAELKDSLNESDMSLYTGYYQIPKLRSDMLAQVEDIPDNLDSWAGSATKDHPDPDQWWLYNWGIDSTSGMKDVSKVIVSFYCWDDYFDQWFDNPRKYVTKLLNSKITMMVTPNYSLWTDSSRALNIYAIYRSRYVGRYAQEAGLKVIPDIIWPEGETKFLREVVLSTLPKKVPVISMQFQTNASELFAVEEKGKIGDEARQALKELQEMIDTLNPEGFIVYTGQRGVDFFKKYVKFEGKYWFIETRMKKLGDSQKNREKKTTI